MLSFLQPRHPLRGLINLLGLWLRRPTSVGAVAPSSRKLAQAMAAQLDPGAPGLVIELGAGTGNITEALAAALPRADELLVVEKEPSLCRILRERFPTLRIVEGDARHLSELIGQSEAASVRAVVSSLPFVSLRAETCRAILVECFRLLGSEGMLIQFTYSPRAPLPGRLCQELGIHGERRTWVLDNLPPAAVWVYRKP